MLPPKIRRAVEIPYRLIQRPIDGFRVFASSGVSATIRFPKGSGFTVERASFDYWMVEKATQEGSKLLQGTDVLRVKETPRGALVVTPTSRLLSRYVVAADGVRSEVRRSVGLRAPSRDQLAFAYQIELEHDEKVIDETVGNYFEAYYDVSIVREGYYWIAPHRNRFFIGFGTPLGGILAPPRRIIAEFLKLKRLKPLIRDARIVGEESHLIPYSGPYEVLGTLRTLFVGDAGGFVHPFTGEGIYYAIVSGRAAAEAISTHRSGDELARLYKESAERRGLLKLKTYIEMVNKKDYFLRISNVINQYVSLFENVSKDLP